MRSSGNEVENSEQNRTGNASFVRACESGPGVNLYVKVHPELSLDWKMCRNILLIFFSWFFFLGGGCNAGDESLHRKTYDGTRTIRYWKQSNTGTDREIHEIQPRFARWLSSKLPKIIGPQGQNMGQLRSRGWWIGWSLEQNYKWN